MSNSSQYTRPQAEVLVSRLLEPRRFIQVISGARQVGKTTLARQAAKRSGLPARYASADEPTLRGPDWIEQQWEAARSLCRDANQGGALLVLDEIQKIGDWSETVKRLWDADSRGDSPIELKVVLLGSAPLLMQRGIGDSLAGRFEIIHLPHWSFTEMREAFDWNLEQYLFFGAYPGAAGLIRQPTRWSSYIRDSLIEPVLSRDVLLLSRIDKPALLRRLLDLSCAYSSQILAYNKMLGQLDDAGNTTTLAHYLDLLDQAGLVTGLAKYAGSAVRQRASSPKLQVFNTALISARTQRTLKQARQDRTFWGRLVESAVGSHLVNAAAAGEFEVRYWRDANYEVDFLLCSGDSLTAIEVKSGRATAVHSGMAAFSKKFQPKRKLLVGGDGIGVEDFLSQPASNWL